jgi:DtxR family Mn-dependent transcriptional regulator
MDEILGSPETDPHGSPIPDRHGQLTYKTYRKLSECAEGEEVVLSALGHSSAEFLTYLNEKEIQLGQKLEILRREPFDGNTTIKYKNHPAEILSVIVAEILLVENVGKGKAI